MKGTRLWQAPGSPIIQGRSRTLRPFWEVWAVGAAGAEVTLIAVVTVLSLRVPGHTFWHALGSAFLTALIPSLPGCMLGAALGVWVARTMGWQRAWLVGLALGLLGGWITTLLI